jgi:chaperonin GroEL
MSYKNADALHATRAAVEEGIVAGGGVALLRARANIKVKGDNPGQEAGIKIVLRAIEELNFLHERAIVSNAGEEPSVVVNKVLSGRGNYGFLVSSVAGLMLTTDCKIAEAPSDDKGQPGMCCGMSGMHGMDM